MDQIVGEGIQIIQDSDAHGTKVAGSSGSLEEWATPRGWAERVSLGRRVLKRFISFEDVDLVSPSPRAGTLPKTLQPLNAYTLQLFYSQ
ncbi:MAG: hypothetical protein RL168_580 [Bacteroidota bacterium]